MPSAHKEYHPPSEAMNQHTEKSSLEEEQVMERAGQTEPSARKGQGGLLPAQRKPQLEDLVST